MMRLIANWQTGSAVLAVLLSACMGFFALTMESSAEQPGITDEKPSCTTTVDCKAPVKRLGRRDDCYCFSCEVKTPEEHIVCIDPKSRDEYQRLLMLSEPQDK